MNGSVKKYAPHGLTGAGSVGAMLLLLRLIWPQFVGVADTVATHDTDLTVVKDTVDRSELAFKELDKEVEEVKDEAVQAKLEHMQEISTINQRIGGIEVEQRVISRDLAGVERQVGELATKVEGADKKLDLILQALD